MIRSRISLLTVSSAIGICRVSGALLSVVQTSQPESSGIITSSRIADGTVLERLLYALAAVAGRERRVPRVVEDGLDDEEHVLVVVDDENAFAGHEVGSTKS